jgi:hypothetical protein
LCVHFSFDFVLNIMFSWGSNISLSAKNTIWIAMGYIHQSLMILFILLINVNDLKFC